MEDVITLITKYRGIKEAFAKQKRELETLEDLAIMELFRHQIRSGELKAELNYKSV